MKPSITVVSMGPGDPGLLTGQTVQAMKNPRAALVLRTGQHPVAAWLREEGRAFSTLDALYDQADSFDELNALISDTLWAEAARHAVVFAVIDASTDASVAALAGAMPEDGRLTRLAGVSMTDACMARLPAELTVVSGLNTLPAIACNQRVPDLHAPLLITELDKPLLASQVKLWLGDLMDEEAEIVFFPSTVDRQRKPLRIPLCDLDRQKRYDHTVCAFIPAMPMLERKRYDLTDLVQIMERLRGDDGCPWDREQTHESLRKHLIEEAYEVAGAIDEDDPDHLADELGDVLLQVVFHASIGQSFGTFTLADVTTAICRKMIYRHAHIFGDAHCDTSEEVSAVWEARKREEKGHLSLGEVMADVSPALPALIRAAKVQKKAAGVGFDWDCASDALPKVYEEADEVRQELDAGRDPGEELGDLFFSCVNVSRLCGCDPEEMLKNATDKFVRRFSAMEKLIKSDGKSLEALTLAEMDVYWNQVKSRQQR